MHVDAMRPYKSAPSENAAAVAGQTPLRRAMAAP